MAAEARARRGVQWGGEQRGGGKGGRRRRERSMTGRGRDREGSDGGALEHYSA